MEKIKSRGLNANQIKMIAILAMTIDHLTWLFYLGCQKLWWVMGLHRRKRRMERNEVVFLPILSGAFIFDWNFKVMAWYGNYFLLRQDKKIKSAYGYSDK